MNKILSIYVIFIVCFYLPEVKLQNPSSFHSFGASFGDTLLPKNDDGFFGPIKLGVGIPFFGNIYPNLFVNTNGVISFLFPINSSVPLLFPMLAPLIAVFWNDLNPLTSGQIYYRESFSTSDLTKAKEDVVKANVSFASYLPSRSFIITWDQVASYGSSTTNTFQAVISTDGKMSFLIFNFGLLGLISKNTQIGGNSGDGVNFYKFPETFTTNTASLAALSNINVPGKWVFKVDSFSSFANMPSKPSFSGNLTKTTYAGVEGYYNKIVALSNQRIAISSGLNYLPNKTELVVFNLENSVIESRFTIGKQIVTTMTLLQDGSIALILEYSSTIDIWNITSGKLMRSYDIKGLTGYNTPYNYYSFSKLQNGAVFLYIGYPSFKICSLNLIDSKLLYITNEILSQTIYDIIAISAISDTKLVLKIRNYATNDNFIKIINPKNGENIKEFKMYNSSYEFGQRTGFNVLPDGSIASTRYNGDGFLEVFNPETSQLKISLKIANLWVCSIDDLPNGSLVTLSGSNEIKIFI